MISATLRNKLFTFETKPGLFSKDKIDTGSKMLIDVMEIEPHDTVIDIGCGYGPIGLAAATLATEGKVYMVDVDIRAVKYSRINAKRNKIENVEILPSDGFEEVKGVEFDIVLSHPPTHMPKETILEIIEGAHRQLKPAGGLYFVVERRVKPLIKREFEKTFGNFKQLAEGPQHIVAFAFRD